MRNDINDRFQLIFHLLHFGSIYNFIVYEQPDNMRNLVASGGSGAGAQRGADRFLYGAYRTSWFRKPIQFAKIETDEEDSDKLK